MMCVVTAEFDLPDWDGEKDMCCLIVEVHSCAPGERPELSCASLKLLDVFEGMGGPHPTRGARHQDRGGTG